MIIFAGTIEVDPAERDDYVRVRVDQVRRARQEPGCLEYAITADSVEPGLVQVFECYADEAALEAHAVQHQRQQGIAVLAMDVHRYDVPDRSRLVL